MKLLQTAALTTAFLLLSGSTASPATDAFRMAWLKAKCAVCHGADGAGSTANGKRRGVPDLRSGPPQKMTDAQLAAVIGNGHSRMPAFHVQLTKEQTGMVIAYIRSLRR